MVQHALSGGAAFVLISLLAGGYESWITARLDDPSRGARREPGPDLGDPLTHDTDVGEGGNRFTERPTRSRKTL